jgi:ATP-dependent RNA helicase SUPV3L1/SUV3
VRFGQHNIFMPLLLKPAPTRLRLILWSLWEGFEMFPEAPPPGLVTIPALADAPRGYYEKVGYRLCGSRALRIDMLERLADLIRPMDVRGGFEATPDMLSITGCTLEQLAEILKSLGFDGERGERPKPVRPAPEATPAEPAEPESSTGKTVADAPEGGAAAEPEAEPEKTPEPEGEAAEPRADEPMPGEPMPGEPMLGEPMAEAPAEPETTKPEKTGPEATNGEIEPEPAEPETTKPDSGAEPEAEAGETGEPEVEVFYTFKLRHRPRHRSTPGPGGPRQRSADGGKKHGASGHGKGGPKDKGPRRARRDPDRDGAAPKPGRPRREDKPVDPLSPFAILQQLKDK